MPLASLLANVAGFGRVINGAGLTLVAAPLLLSKYLQLQIQCIGTIAEYRSLNQLSLGE